MSKKFLIIIIVISSALALKEPELPLCPTNFQYFPQNLPLHCRMPTPGKSDSVSPPKPPAIPINMFTFPPPYYQSPPPNAVPPPMPFPVPSGFPGMPGPMPMPLLPLVPPPSHKLPVIVMPIYSPDPNYKKSEDRKNKVIPPYPKPPRRHSDSSSSSSSETDMDSSTDTESNGFRKRVSRAMNKKSRKHRRHRNKHRSRKMFARRHSQDTVRRRNHNKQDDLLTPIIQYVSKDGYVIFEKEISKSEAKDWLGNKPSPPKDDNKMTYQELDAITSDDEKALKAEREAAAKKEIQEINERIERKDAQFPQNENSKKSDASASSMEQQSIYAVTRRPIKIRARPRKLVPGKLLPDDR